MHLESCDPCLVSSNLRSHGCKLSPQTLLWQEPQKHDDWQWVEWESDGFPTPLFAALDNIRKAGFNPFAN